jgi:chromate transport protein ChrA
MIMRTTTVVGFVGVLVFGNFSGGVIQGILFCLPPFFLSLNLLCLFTDYILLFKEAENFIG